MGRTNNQTRKNSKTPSFMQMVAKWASAGEMVTDIESLSGTLIHNTLLTVGKQAWEAYANKRPEVASLLLSTAITWLQLKQLIDSVADGVFAELQLLDMEGICTYFKIDQLTDSMLASLMVAKKHRQDELFHELLARASQQKSEQLTSVLGVVLLSNCAISSGQHYRFDEFAALLSSLFKVLASKN